MVYQQTCCPLMVADCTCHYFSYHNHSWLSVCLCGKAETRHGSSYGHQPFWFSCHSQAKISPWTYMGWKSKSVQAYVFEPVGQKVLVDWTSHTAYNLCAHLGRETGEGHRISQRLGVYMRGGGVIKRGEAVYSLNLCIFQTWDDDTITVPNCTTCSFQPNRQERKNNWVQETTKKIWLPLHQTQNSVCKQMT